MDLRILPDRRTVNAAVAVMSPCAREAAELLAHRLTSDRTIMLSSERLKSEWIEACGISFLRHHEPQSDKQPLRSFIESQGHGVLNVGVSIVHVLDQESRRSRWLRWAKASAAVAAGVAIGSFFG